MAEKELIVVGGPNGAGKTTYAKAFCGENEYPYLGADAIAYELSPDDPAKAQVAAGREMLRRLQELLEGEESFVLESTLSGRSLRRALEQAKANGFYVTVVFIFLDSAQSSLVRVHQRVRQGGHDVPEEDVRRRFPRTASNFWNLYRPIANQWLLVYNEQMRFTDVASGDETASEVVDVTLFQRFLKLVEENDE